MKGKIKTFLDEGTLREFVTSRPTLKEWLRKFLKWEEMIKEGISEHQERRKKHWKKQKFE